MILQYKRIGKWKNYVYGERVYIILSLVAKPSSPGSSSSAPCSRKNT
jgi:hypothetical protein